MNLAPLALFAYRRPDHTRRLLQSLLANPEIAGTPVVAFLDGPRDPGEADAVAATREVIRSAGIPQLTLVERSQNLGLARSIIEGVTRVCSDHGRVIVLEDDLVISPTFLEYMNVALSRFQEAAKVYSISAFMYPVDLRIHTDAVFLPFISSWGWATWQRAWQTFDIAASGYAALKTDRSLQRRFDLNGHYPFFDMLEAQQTGGNDSWAVRWYLSVFLRGGLSLFPVRSLVENQGFGAGGTHCLGDTPSHVKAVANPLHVRTFPDVMLDEEVFRRVIKFMHRDHTLAGKTRAVLGSALRRLRK